MSEKKESKLKRREVETLLVFVTELLSFYQKNKRSLPWRRRGISSYEVWVSEIMLQQTQVSRVILYYTRFLERFPDIKSLSEVSWEEFLPYYQGLGYYRRARNMLETAKKVTELYAGIFPRVIDQLEGLPGVGTYTARAIASFSNGDPVLAWDTNFSRVFGRFFYGSKERKISVLKFEKDIFEQVSQRRGKKIPSRDINSAVMDFGSLVCLKNPKCEVCPLNKQCVYFFEEGKGERKITLKKDSFPTKDAIAYVILHENHKVYFSSSNKIFTPFILTQGASTREGIKNFFESTYGLVVSVRPPKMKLFVKGEPVLVVYAQILSGIYNFSVFSAKAVRDTVNTWL